MGFLESQGKKFSPFFSETGRPIGLKFFLQQLDPKWGVYFFFFLKNTVWIQNEKQNTGDPRKVLRVLLL